MKATLKNANGEKKEVHTRKRTTNGTASGIAVHPASNNAPTPPQS